MKMTHSQKLYPLEQSVRKVDFPTRGGIYAIRNRNGRTYVGATHDFQNRFNQHRQALRRGKHPNLNLQEAYNVNDETFFDFLVVLGVQGRSQVLNYLEAYWIYRYRHLSGVYNVFPKPSASEGFWLYRRWTLLELLNKYGIDVEEIFSKWSLIYHTHFLRVMTNPEKSEGFISFVAVDEILRILYDITGHEFYFHNFFERYV